MSNLNVMMSLGTEPRPPVLVSAFRPNTGGALFSDFASSARSDSATRYDHEGAKTRNRNSVFFLPDGQWMGIGVQARP